MAGSDLLGLLKDVLSKGSPFRFRARGSSMSPFIKDGDVVTVSPLHNSNPTIGDVVAFVSPGSDGLLIHRIVSKSGDHFLIMGDNIPKMGDRVPKNKLLGRILRVERNDRDVSFGLGPERVLIALLNRKGLLSPLILFIWKHIRPFFKRGIP